MVSNVWLGMKQICCLLFFSNWSIVVACFSKHAFVLHYTYVCIITLLQTKIKPGHPIHSDAMYQLCCKFRQEGVKAKINR